MTIRKWQLPYVGYVLGHPFDGFYDLKHEKRGSGVTAALLYVLLGLSALCRGRYTEYLFDPSGSKENALWQLVIAVGPYVLWCVANWCFTSLMDGEGGLADMLLATGYALTPQIIANFLVTGLSWILVSEEASILSAVSAIGSTFRISLCPQKVSRTGSTLAGAYAYLYVIDKIRCHIPILYLFNLSISFDKRSNTSSTVPMPTTG